MRFIRRYHVIGLVVAAIVLTAITVAQGCNLNYSDYNECGSALTLTKMDGEGNPLWEKSLGGDKGAYAWRVQNTNDGGFVAVGVLSLDGFSAGPIYLVRTNSEGKAIWEKTFGRSKPYDLGLGLLPLPDGGFIVAGDKLTKLDSDGNLLWERDIAGHATDVQLTSDGGFAIAGAAPVERAGVSSDPFLTRMDADGNVEWERIFEGSQDSYGLCLLQTSDGGFLLGGGRDSFHYDDDSHLIKTDSEGNLEWEKVFLWLPAQRIIETGDGGIVLVGSDWEGVDGYWAEDSHLVRLDADGNFEWHVKVDAAIRDLEETPDGGLLLIGGYLGPGWSQYAYLAKTDSEGNLLWDRAYGSSENDDVFISIQETTDGNFILAGSTVNWSCYYYGYYYY